MGSKGFVFFFQSDAEFYAITILYFNYVSILVSCDKKLIPRYAAEVKIFRTKFIMWF